VDHRQQAIEIVQRSKDRINTAVIRNIVSEVGHRRRKDRGQPDRINAEFDKMA
jgi:hypothetical protein